MLEDESRRQDVCANLHTCEARHLPLRPFAPEVPGSLPCIHMHLSPKSVALGGQYTNLKRSHTLSMYFVTRSMLRSLLYTFP